MGTEIRLLTTDDLEALFAMRQVTYLDTSDYSLPEQRARHLERLPFQYGLFAEGRLASSLVLYPFQMYFAGRELPLAGLGSVQTPPEFRRRGYVQRLLHHGLEQQRAAGVGLCMEYPFDPRFYGRYGWQSVWGGLRVHVPPERLLGRGAPPDALRLDPLAPDTGERLAALHAPWARQYHLPLTRAGHGGRDWFRVLQPHGETRPAHVYLLEDAYCLLRLDRVDAHDEVRVVDYAFRTPAGRARLWSFLGTFTGQARGVSMQLATDEPLLWDVPEFLRPVPHHLQVRIVDVKTALEQLPSPLEASFSLAVRDDFCAWNARTFQVHLHPERIQVEPRSEGATADLTLDIRTLAAVLCGSLTEEAGARTGAWEGSAAAARALVALAGARRAFAPEPDYF
jgi:predicted acetyltransferase